MRKMLLVGGGTTAIALSMSVAFSQIGDRSPERGEYLVNGILACANCHTPRGPDLAFIEGMHLAGGLEIDELPAFHAYTRNITPDPETGIGTWTDEEIARAIREGITPEGEVGPPMPIFTYNRMSDDDVMAVVAYLRSIPAVYNEVPEGVYNIPKPLPGPALGLQAPPPSDRVAYGDYLVNALGHCFECHTPMGPDGMPDFTRLGAGGFPMFETPLGTIRSANITNDAETGLGGWTDEEIRRALTEGISRHGEHLFPIMPYDFFRNMTDEDIDAVIAYLRTVPAVHNEVEKVDWMAAFGIPQP
jgi:mono/diheme cytochrome c family protein